MTETGDAERPSPQRALEAAFGRVWREHMQGLPMVNPALTVEAVGFEPWQAHWLGVLVTPWFMNLVLMPRLHAQWPRVRERESRHFVFPAGVFEFIGAHDAELGDYMACSLFSPMFEFADPEAARATALAALQALFDPACRAPGAAPQPAPVGSNAAAGTPATTPSHGAAALSKRGFLFGVTPRAGREP